MILYVPRNDTEFHVEYDYDDHTIEVEVGGEAFDPDGLFVDASDFGQLDQKIVRLKTYLLEKAYAQWLEDGGLEERRIQALEAYHDARNER